jgi:S-sulfo-L-cysteine synthase (O-acetyl-L-serine-dependent)
MNVFLLINNNMIYKNILQTIGNTPIVKINKINSKSGVNIYTKLEGANPGGSIKDRIALKMIEVAVANGELTKGKTIIEATSGNTGIALAMIGAVKGYRVEIVMSAAVSVERRKMIEAFGAKTILTDQDKGTDGAIIKAKELVKANPEKYFLPDQFSNEYNKIAHYETTAQEIWQQLEGQINYFVSAVGTSGTLMGVGTYLKKQNPQIKIVSAEPVKGHYIQGLKNMEEALVPAIYNRDLLDEIVMIDTEEAFAMSRSIIKEEGIFVGMSSGAALLAAIKIADKIKSGNIVTIFPDRGEKYLSTKLFA